MLDVFAVVKQHLLMDTPYGRELSLSTPV